MTAVTPASPPPAPASQGVTKATLIWIGVAVVLLSFVASFLGAWLARSVDTAAEPTPTPSPTSTMTQEDYEEALAEILPAGAAVRVGTGTPESGKGYPGEVYIDRATANVYVFEDGDWKLAGNIRTSAAENLTGQTGAAGSTGATGETGAPGTPGTQVVLGLGAPDDLDCTADGDVYIDTEISAYYECSGGVWVLFGPPTAAEPSPTPTP